ncbi:hypothetical protein [Azospirillum sp.]|uniref:hypothetical protein n=1 Tax=Azospirillum sp. TaxID=34012 RepID=UPI002D57C586|nr:hypothetical protein [Azospirillum sp.]HYD67826.1 hypothetical protein [Azospirillum sp.]
MELILFERDGSIYALPADATAQVAVDSPLKPLPFPCAPVEGFVLTGGRALVAIDLAARLHPATPILPLYSPLPETLEVRSTAGTFAIRVRRVLGRMPMARIPLDALTLGADPHDAPNAAGQPVIASFDWRGRHVLLLDPEALRVADPARQRVSCERRPEPQDTPTVVEAPCAPAPPPFVRFRRPGAWPD